MVLFFLMFSVLHGSQRSSWVLQGYNCNNLDCIFPQAPVTTLNDGWFSTQDVSSREKFLLRGTKIDFDACAANGLPGRNFKNTSHFSIKVVRGNKVTFAPRKPGFTNARLTTIDFINKEHKKMKHGLFTQRFARKIDFKSKNTEGNGGNENVMIRMPMVPTITSCSSPVILKRGSCVNHVVSEKEKNKALGNYLHSFRNNCRSPKEKLECEFFDFESEVTTENLAADFGSIQLSTIPTAVSSMVESQDVSRDITPFTNKLHYKTSNAQMTFPSFAKDKECQRYSRHRDGHIPKWVYTENLRPQSMLNSARSTIKIPKAPNTAPAKMQGTFSFSGLLLKQINRSPRMKTHKVASAPHNKVQAGQNSFSMPSSPKSAKMHSKANCAESPEMLTAQISHMLSTIPSVEGLVSGLSQQQTENILWKKHEENIFNNQFLQATSGAKNYSGKKNAVFRDKIFRTYKK